MHPSRVASPTVWLCAGVLLVAALVPVSCAVGEGNELLTQAGSTSSSSGAGGAGGAASTSSGGQGGAQGQGGGTPAMCDGSGQCATCQNCTLGLSTCTEEYNDCASDFECSGILFCWMCEGEPLDQCISESSPNGVNLYNDLAVCLLCACPGDCAADISPGTCP
jgi:hypothetical protein